MAKHQKRIVQHTLRSSTRGLPDRTFDFIMVPGRGIFLHEVGTHGSKTITFRQLAGLMVMHGKDTETP